MKIKEIIVETISEGRVYGWIDPHGQEFQTQETNDLRHHNDVLRNLKAKGIAGTEHWNDDRLTTIEGVAVEYVSQALADGWIRIGAMAGSFVFAQFSPKAERRPLNYLLRIILKFKPPRVTLDLMDDNGKRYKEADFNSPRKAIAWIRKETGV